MNGCQLGCHVFLLVSGVGFAAAPGWSRHCFYCLVSRRICLKSGLCGVCRQNYIEVSSHCVKEHLYGHSRELQGSSKAALVDSGSDDSQFSKELKMAWPVIPWAEWIAPSESDNGLQSQTFVSPAVVARSPNSDVSREVTSSPLSVEEYKKTTGLQLLSTVKELSEQLAAPANNGDTILSAAGSHKKQIGVDAGAHSTKRLVESTMSDNIREILTTEMTVSHSDDRLSDLYLLIVIICLCIIAVMGLIIAFMCWSKMKNQILRMTDSEYRYKKLPYRENATVNGCMSAQQAELFMYNQKRQQLKCRRTSHTESGLLGEMQLDVGGRPSNLQPGEDKDTLYETPGLSHLQDIKIVNPVFQPFCHSSSLPRSTEASSPSSTGSN